MAAAHRFRTAPPPQADRRPSRWPGRYGRTPRVSTRDQNPQLQLDALEASGYDTLVQEKESAKRGVFRPAWQELLPLPQPGDTLKFWKSDRTRLAPVPGPVQPILGDRKRQEASAFTWAYVTQGEPRFAPHPIQDSQPEPVQRNWARNRSSTWSLLARPGRFVHYAELRKLLTEHGDRLAEDIDYSG
jgi:Resolvase, N terminal domain